MKELPLVLFVCTHNAARSQMAEALLRRLAGDRFRVASAGLEPTAVHPLTHRVLAEVGLDSSAQHAKGLHDFLGRVSVRYAIIVCADSEEKCARVFPFSAQTVRWAFDDPTTPERAPELQLAKFRRVRDEIDARLRSWLRGA